MDEKRIQSPDGSDDEFEDCPTQKEKAALARKIGNKWKKLGRALKLNEPDLENIKSNYSEFGQEELAIQVMNKWEQYFGKDATKKVLIQALVEIGININRIKIEDDLPDDIAEIYPDCPTLEDIYRTAKLIGDKWRPLGRKLILRETDLDNIKSDHLLEGQEEFAVQVMWKWKQSNGEKATKKLLIRALVAIGIKGNDLAEIFPKDEIPLPDDDITTDSCSQLSVAPMLQNCRKLYSNIDVSVSPAPISVTQTHTEVYSVDAIMKRIRKQMTRHQAIQLPGISWLINKFLPLEKLFVDLEMFEKNALGEEKSGVKVELNEIFDAVNGEKPTRILLEGKPGYGKTTLIHKLFSDWVNKAKYMPPSFSLIFIISLREFHGTFNDFFFHQILTDKFSDCLNGISDATKLKLLMENEENILLLLDGYDELNQESKKELSRLLEEKQYPLMTVILTSRPGQFHIPNSSNLTQQSYQQKNPNIFWQKRIEIKGIPEMEREKFLENYLGKDFNLYEKLPGFLRKQIYELFECPLYLLLIAISIENHIAKDIDGRTSLYKIAINFLIKRNLVRDKVLKDDKMLDVFGSCEHAKKYKDLLVKFGELSLELLKDNRLFITDDDILKFFDNISDLIQLGFVVKNIRIFSYQEEEHYEVVHKTFMEFLAAFYIVTNLVHNGCVKDEICNLIKADITPINNEMFFAFLSGLMGNNFFEVLSNWKFVYPLNRQPITSYFLEQKTSELSKASLLISSYWIMDDTSKYFPKSKNHTGLMRIGERKNLIQTIRWNIHYVIFIPLTISIPCLVLDIKETNATDLNEVISKLQNVKGRIINCENLLCRFFTFDSKISDLILQLFSFINPVHIGISIYGVNHNLNTLISFIHQCINGIWSQKRLSSLGFHKITVAKINQSCFDLLIKLINESISQGVGIHLDDQHLDEECKFRIETIIKAAGNSRIEEFALSLKSKKFVMDIQSLCRSGIKQWKTLYFWGDIVFSHLTEPVPLKIEKVEFLWKMESVDACVKLISSSSTLTELKCDMAVLKTLAAKFDCKCKFITKLQLILLNKTFQPSDIKALHCFSNLEILSLDLANLRAQSLFQEIPKILLNVLSNKKLKILSIRRIEERVVVFVTNLLKGILTSVPKERLPLFDELNIWMTCDANVEFITCMNYVKELLKQKFLKRFLLTDLRGFNSLQDLICQLFDVREFRIERNVEPIQTKEVILCNKDLTYEENITEMICIEIINKD